MEKEPTIFDYFDVVAEAPEHQVDKSIINVFKDWSNRKYVPTDSEVALLANTGAARKMLSEFAFTAIMIIPMLMSPAEEIHKGRVMSSEA